MNIAINGFGRIGRAIFRLLIKEKKFSVRVINDLNKDIKNICYNLKYDSIHGKLKNNISTYKNTILFDNKKIKYFCKKKINQVDWKKYNIDILIDSSGTKENMEIINKDFKLPAYNILTQAAYDQKNIKTIIFGVNENNINLKINKKLSASICDTVAFFPLFNLIEKNFEVINGDIITLHPWLSFQNLLDGKSASWSVPGDTFSHYSLGRSSVLNLIPKSTSAINAANLLSPNLSNKINSISFRVPTNLVCASILTLNLKQNISVLKFNKLLNQFIKRQKYKIMKINNEPLTSIDFIGEEYSLILDNNWTIIKDKKIRLMYWYDNEIGYSSKVVDIMKKIKFENSR